MGGARGGGGSLPRALRYKTAGNKPHRPDPTFKIGVLATPKWKVIATGWVVDCTTVAMQLGESCK